MNKILKQNVGKQDSGSPGPLLKKKQKKIKQIGNQINHHHNLQSSYILKG